jgi:hypothetical protein
VTEKEMQSIEWRKTRNPFLPVESTVKRHGVLKALRNDILAVAGISNPPSGLSNDCTHFDCLQHILRYDGARVGGI